jgi:hypothetical protein
MAQTLTGQIYLTLSTTETLIYGPQSLAALGTFTVNTTFANGTSATAAAINNQYVEGANNQRTLAAGASVTLTLSALVDQLGRTVSMAGGVRALAIIVTSRTAGDFLTVGAAATNPWTALFSGTTPALKVWDLLVLSVYNTADKYAVTAASSEQLKITNSGSNPITFEIAILGCAT